MGEKGDCYHKSGTTYVEAILKDRSRGGRIMKANIKKLALLMVITVVASLILAATVTANPPGHQALRGQYASTGSGTALIALCGFPAPPDDTYIPIGAEGFAWAIQAVSSQGVWTFEPDGTGTASATQRVVNHYSPAPPQVGRTPWAGVRTLTYSFTYTVEKDGTIIITADPFTSTWVSGPNKNSPPTHISTLTLEGKISPDGKTIILNGGLPEIADLGPLIPDPRCPNAQLISNSSAILIWQHR
jgi:hypothetical protein